MSATFYGSFHFSENFRVWASKNTANFSSIFVPSVGLWEFQTSMILTFLAHKNCQNFHTSLHYPLFWWFWNFVFNSGNLGFPFEVSSWYSANFISHYGRFHPRTSANFQFLFSREILVYLGVIEVSLRITEFFKYSFRNFRAILYQNRWIFTQLFA